MFIRCKSISGRDIPIAQRFPGESIEANYSPLVVSEEYCVFAILFYTNRVDYLISPNESSPIWAPSSLFDVIDSKLDKNFHVATIEIGGQFSWLNETYGAQFIVGYQKITESFTHFVGLIERNEADLTEFAREKLKRNN